jgi:putative SOS response-associated peptidase YedK
MCGRYVSTKSTSDLLDEFDAVDATDATPIEPDYNIAPTKSIPTIVNRPLTARGSTQAHPSTVVEPTTPPEAVRQLRLAHWGLVPSWAKDRSIGNKLINARAETLADKPAFRRAFAKRRCLIPADGWYEWLPDTDERGKPRKQPFFMTPTDHHTIALAGLYEFWRPKDAPDGTELLLSATILTVESRGDLAEIHERMPLVLDRRDWQRWLDPASDGPVDLLQAADEAAREHLELRPVSTQVNSVKNNAPELLARVDPPAPALELF